MRLFGVRQSLLATGVLVAASCISCSHHGSKSGQAGASRNAKPSPEESFKLIDETFRRRVAETPVGFVVSDSTGRTSMVGTNTVSSELIPPANETEPYKAIITVVSESRYSILRTKESPEEKPRDENAKAKSDDPLAETGDEKGFESFDPGLVSKPAAEGSKAHAIPLVTKDVITPPTPDRKDVRKYELVYQNGRWTLVTELNSKTEQSIQNAFRNALDTQS